MPTSTQTPPQAEMEEEEAEGEEESVLGGILASALAFLNRYTVVGMVAAALLTFFVVYPRALGVVVYAFTSSASPQRKPRNNLLRVEHGLGLNHTHDAKRRSRLSPAYHGGKLGEVFCRISLITHSTRLRSFVYVSCFTSLSTSNSSTIVDRSNPSLFRNQSFLVTSCERVVIVASSTSSPPRVSSRSLNSRMRDE
jgi:hypothetical protein